ncbi:MAG: DnaA regulatory inactivator Hda [Gammaproteobacteria bacterium]|nr:DnaA regulatory inactivator Hda [Pseudomonadales bacterium]MCP5345956.1 DnaA regulatory inactivator Hda [Pseudomonadales bacterium]
MNASQPQQLLLGFRLDDSATLENFTPAASDEQLVRHLREQAIQRGDCFTYLWGRPGTGKTHLLQALCNELAGGGASPIYLPLSRSDQLAPAMLDGLEHLDLICLDELESIAGQEEWERALFNFYNRAREQQARFVVAAATPPGTLPVQLPDLRSRLQSAMVYQLHELSDREKGGLLRHRAAELGIRLPEPVVNYVLDRHDRNPAALMALLRTLDRQSLERKRRITIPLVREIMGW